MAKWMMVKMKVRKGFVSNSSSSSFILLKKDLTEEEEKRLTMENIYREALLLGYKPDMDDFYMWSLNNNYDHYKFETIMDNFALDEVIEKMGLGKALIRKYPIRW